MKPGLVCVMTVGILVSAPVVFAGVIAGVYPTSLPAGTTASPALVSLPSDTVLLDYVDIGNPTADPFGFGTEFDHDMLVLCAGAHPATGCDNFDGSGTSWSAYANWGGEDGRTMWEWGPVGSTSPSATMTLDFGSVPTSKYIAVRWLWGTSGGDSFDLQISDHPTIYTLTNAAAGPTSYMDIGVWNVGAITGLRTVTLTATDPAWASQTIYGQVYLSEIAVFQDNVKTTKVALVARDLPSTSDAVDSLPLSIGEVPVNDTFYVELWAQTLDLRGLSSVFADIQFDPDMLQATGLSNTAAFSLFGGEGEIDNVIGLVDDLGGNHLDPGCVSEFGTDPQWVRAGVIEMVADASGIANLTCANTGSALYDLVVCGVAGTVDPDAVDYQGVSLEITEIPASGDLVLSVPGAPAVVEQGQTVTVDLRVANLTSPINGVQALMHYDTSLLALTGIVPAAGVGWVEVGSSDVGGDIAYSVGIPGVGSTGADGIVATLTFLAVGVGEPVVTFLPDNPPSHPTLITKLTDAATAAAIIPGVTDTTPGDIVIEEIPASGDLVLSVPGAPVVVEQGQTVTVDLRVANLTSPINGVQALMHYDTSLLALTDIVPAAGVGWVEVSSSDVGGDIAYSVGIPGVGSTDADGTVATLTFLAVGVGEPVVTFLPDNPPSHPTLITKLTDASTAAAIIPGVTDTTLGDIVIEEIPASGDLVLSVPGAPAVVEQGQTVTVDLRVASLTSPINGVQALIHYDTALLSLVDIIPAAGVGWVEVSSSDVGGDIAYSVGIPGVGSTDADGTVATLTFLAVGVGEPVVTFLPDNPPSHPTLITKLTDAATAAAIIPGVTDTTLGDIVVSACADEIACTDDAFDGSACIFVPNNANCDNGILCDGVEWCDPTSGCRPGTAPDCDDDDPCTQDSCDALADVCVNTYLPAVLDPPMAEAIVVAKNRYISLVPGNAGIQTALRVTLVGSTEFPGQVGSSWWVEVPAEYCENSGQTTPPQEGCGDAGGGPLTFWAASLGCTPHYRDWGALPDTLHVYGRHIVPDATYEVEMVESGLPAGCDALPSEALAIDTSRWCDVCGSDGSQFCNAGPDTVVDIVSDLVGIMDKFENKATGLPTARADLVANSSVDAGVNLIIDVLDFLVVIDAFEGGTYPLGGPEACPP